MTKPSEDRERILCVGVSPSFDLTLHLDGRLDADRVNRVSREMREAGGKALNVARELCRQNTPCGLLSLLGEKNAAEYTAAATADFPGIRTHSVTREGSVRENLTVLTGDGGTYKINRTGDPLGADTLAELEAAVERLSFPDGTAVFSGNMPAGMTSDDYAGLMRAAARQGARLAIDTTALSLEQLTGLHPWLCKPNEHELLGLFGYADEAGRDLIALARELAESVDVVLLTMGSRGLAAVTRSETVIVPPKPVRVVNTVGAGDSALAGFIAEYVRGGDLRSCAEAASASGAAAVSREGTGR